MARQGFKRGWTRIVPHPIEHSTYMLFASLALIVMFLFWRPIPTTVWNIENPIGEVFMWALFAIGWAIVLMSTFLLSLFELFGLPQLWSPARGQTDTPPTCPLP